MIRIQGRLRAIEYGGRTTLEVDAMELSEHLYPLSADVGPGPRIGNERTEITDYGEVTITITENYQKIETHQRSDHG